MKETPLPVCFNCEYWRAEPGALDQEHAQKAGSASDIFGIPVGYGKCTITKPELGTLSVLMCVVRDENGDRMFTQIPED